MRNSPLTCITRYSLAQRIIIMPRHPLAQRIIIMPRHPLAQRISSCRAIHLPNALSSCRAIHLLNDQRAPFTIHRHIHYAHTAPFTIITPKFTIIPPPHSTSSHHHIHQYRSIHHPTVPARFPGSK
jgi:hypothetical protein